MATPPTRVSYNVPTSGNFSSTTSPKTTASFDVVAGDLIVVLCSIESAFGPSSVTPSASGGSVTWTSRATQNAGGSNQSAAYCWTGAVGATATGITVSLNRPTTDTTLHWGMSATLWRDHGGVGTTFSGSNGTGSGAPSVAGAAACAANSAVMCQVNDWNAADGTSRTWRTINGAAESESTYYHDSARHTVYGGYRTDTGASASITQGLTAPSTQRWVLVGVEILGTTGGTTPIAGTETGAGADTGTVAPAITGTDTGAGAESGSLSATATAADTAASTESSTIGLAGIGDTGTGSDTGTLSAALTGTDAATAADSGSLAASPAGTDNATAADTSSVVVSVTAADTAAGVDAATVDTGSGDASKTGSDTAAGTEAGTTATSTTATDTAAAADTAAVVAAPTASDTATATESATVTVILASSDAATAADLAALAASVAAAELAATLEAASYVDPGVVVGAAPPARTMVVPAETRVLTVPAESRTLIVPAENRTLEA